MPDASRFDYEFLGWYTEDGFKVTADDTVTESHTLVAHWAYKGIPFTDVPHDEWYYEPVANLYHAGVINGVTETLYMPLADTTRGQIITMLYRMAGAPEVSGDCIFVDVAEDTYYYDAVLWGTEAGVINGISPDEFAPEDNVTREQFMAMLYRMSGTKEDKDHLGAFRDADEISSYAAEAMNWAVQNRLIRGDNEQMLRPGDFASRADTAMIFYRFMEYRG